MEEEQTTPTQYTEFFSWGSDSHGQLALANSEDDEEGASQSSPARQNFY